MKKLLILMLLVCSPAFAGRVRGPVYFDHDRDGDTDNVIVCDWDKDGDTDEEDIKAAQIECDDSDGCLLEFCAATFELDEDNDGVGDDGGAGGLESCSECSGSRSRPHLTLNSNETWIGWGQDVTILELSAASLHGDAPLVGTNVDGLVTTVSTPVIEFASIRGMTIQTNAVNTTSNQASCQTSYGIDAMDCSDCTFEDLMFRRLGHTSIFGHRTPRIVARNISAERVGNYDTDGEYANATCVGATDPWPCCTGPGAGTGTCDTPACSQPGIYLYATEGVNIVDPIFENIRMTQVGGTGVTPKAKDHVIRPNPQGDDALTFNATQQRIAQEFDPEDAEGQRVQISSVIIELRIEDNSAPTAAGEISVTVETTTAGEPDGGAVTGYEAGDFDVVTVEELGPGWRKFRLMNDETDRTTLISGTLYAIVVAYDGHTTDADEVAIRWDDQAGADTYDGGDVSVYSGAAWENSQANKDLNFAIMGGEIIRPKISNVWVRDVSGVNGTGNNCMGMDGTVDAVVDNFHCNTTRAILFGQNAPNIGTILSNWSVVDYFGSTSTGGLRLGDFSSGTVARNGVTRGINGDNSCISFKNWVSGVTLEHIDMQGCGAAGIDLTGGNRDIMINAVSIDGVGADGSLDAGIWVNDTTADTDGVSGRAQRITLQNSKIRNTVGTGIRLVDAVNDINIVNNIFEWNAATPIQATNGGDSNARIRIIGNTIWEPGSNAFVVNGDYDQVQIIGNMIAYDTVSTPFSGMQLDFVTGADFIVSNNIVDGAYSGGSYLLNGGASINTTQFVNNIGAVADWDGSDEAVSTHYFGVTAPTNCNDGDTFTDLNGGAGTTFHVCESGSWAAM